MAQILEELWEGQPNGTNVSVTSTPSLSIVARPGTSQITYSTDWSIEGTRSAKFVTDATAQAPTVTFDPPAAGPIVATRAYARFSTIPATSMVFHHGRTTTNNARWDVRLNPTGTISLRSGAGGTTEIFTTAMAITADQQFRVDVLANATAGTITMHFFVGTDVLSGSPTETSGALSYTLGTTSRIRWGIIEQTANQTFYVDGLGVDDAAFMGSVLAGSNFLQSPSDNLGLTDAPGREDHSGIGSDLLGLSDAIVPLLTQVVVTNHSLTFDESIGVTEPNEIQDFDEFESDSLDLTDSTIQDRSGALDLLFDDDAGTVDAIIPNFAGFIDAAFTDNVNLSDNTIRTYDSNVDMDAFEIYEYNSTTSTWVQCQVKTAWAGVWN